MQAKGLRGADGSKLTAFGAYLRFGRRLPSANLPDEVEVKFNPYHDPRNGQFTFGPGGRLPFTADRPRSGRPPERPSTARSAESAATVGGRSRHPSHYASTDARNPENHGVYIVQRGDTLTRVAAKRKGLRVSDVAWLNGIAAGSQLRIGQKLKLPHQVYLDAGRDAKNTFLALDYYIDTHNGALPPNVAHPPSLANQILRREQWKRTVANGYGFDVDTIGRTREVNGVIRLNPDQKRSKTEQALAGGADRLPTDHGGHYIAREFDGPTKAFNHFAQDAKFNRAGYRSLEIKLRKISLGGTPVRIKIIPTFPGLSRRPSNILVIYTVRGVDIERKFRNLSQEK